MGDARQSDDADDALFLAEVADGRPLDDRARVRAPFERGRRPANFSPAPRLSVDLDRSTGRASGLADGELDRLAAGRVRPDASLDLHGLHEDAAATTLERFLVAARGAGHRCVLVVTGKGLHSTGGPILRHAVPDLLAVRLAAHVRAFAPARPDHGGDGALYVLLTPPDRRPRR
jgi:DNA-nicking Smr family endonuclease